MSSQGQIYLNILIYHERSWSLSYEDQLSSLLLVHVLDLVLLAETGVVPEVHGNVLERLHMYKAWTDVPVFI